MQQRSDTPIFSPEADLFALSPFAQRVMRVVRASQLRDTMVIGLNGSGGGGKTSTLNLTLAWLMAAERAGIDRFAAIDRTEREAMADLLSEVHPDDHPAYLADLARDWGGPAAGGDTVIIRFEPWLLSGQETLVSDFFRLLGRRVDTVLAEGAADLRAAAEQLAEAIDSSWRPPLSAVEAGRRGGIKGLLRKPATAASASAPATLADIREQLVIEMEKLTVVSRRVLVVIDDIDRLRPEEVRPLLSMLKTLGALPNLTFLIGYDRLLLDQALHDHGAGDGGLSPFLEKIVQVDLELPRVAGPRLLDGLATQSAELFGLPLHDNERADLLQTFDRRPSLLKTPRDVGRLRNALAFTDAATGRSIRTTDLMRMEMIRLKERDVFDWMIRNAIYFHPRIGMPALDGTAGETAFLEQGLALASPANRGAVIDALSRTFETVAQAIGGQAPEPRDRLHARDLRYPLSSWEGWECYLQSFPDTDMIPQEEWIYARQVCADLTRSRSYVQTLLSRKRADGQPMLLSFLSGLERLPPGGGEPVGLLNALLELPDNLVALSFGRTHRSALRELHRLLVRCAQPQEMLLGLMLKEGVNPFAVLVVLEYFAEQLGLMSKSKPKGAVPLTETDIGELISTVYLRMSSLPAERSAEWFSTVELHRLLALSLDAKTLYQFAQKVLSKSSDELRYFLEDACTNWPSRHGVRPLLVRRPDPALYPLEDMRNYATRMARKHPGDSFYPDFAQAADEFLTNPSLKDRAQRLKAQAANLGES